MFEPNPLLSSYLQHGQMQLLSPPASSSSSKHGVQRTQNASARRGSKGQRKSATPVGRPRKAKANSKALRVITNMQVKQEMPDDIDFLAPMTPPSPTDDPLLLKEPSDSEPILQLKDEDMRSMALDDWSEVEETQNIQSPIVIEEATNLQEDYDVPTIEEDVSDDDTSDTADESCLVKITSADPRAAARAVAILKQHDYDCFTKLSKQRRASHSPVVDLAKQSRRKDVSSAGIVKATDRRRRRSTMGVIGDKVLIPGSPVTTLPDLLQRAEDDIRRSRTRSASISVMEQDSPRTPVSVRLVNQDDLFRSVSTIPEAYPAGTREWTKADWKLLDACFTDQRISPGGFHCMLAPVDTVSLEDVVARFVDIMGGESLIVTFGEAWSKDNLLERARALQKKQRSGSVAPPTTPMSSSFASPFNFPTGINSTDFLRPTMNIPDFTPIHVGRDNIYEKFPFQRSGSVALPTTPIPFPSFAPPFDFPTSINSADFLRSNPNVHDFTPLHLGHDDASNKFTFHRSPRRSSIDCSSDSMSNAEQAFHDPPRCSVDPDVPRRDSNPVNHDFSFRDFFSSYLPMLSKKPPPSKMRMQGQPTLPLPPPSVLEKPRGPVATPVRPLAPRDPHPKDLVNLNHVSLPPSNIPRARPLPKRLVELIPVPQVGPRTTSREVVPRPRRSSGSTVKDLVSGFEQMEKSACQKFVEKIRTSRPDNSDSRPKWKP